MRRYFLVMWVIAAAAAAASGAGTRVEVIVPSTPVVDDYFPAYIIAAREGRPATDYRGEVWMWTDGPYLRPYHVEFRPADRGLIRLPVRFSGPVTQRVETYELGSSTQISTWSNPVLPVAEDAPRLLWGALDNCSAPGLDFCLSESGGAPALPGLAEIGLRVAWGPDRRAGFVLRPWLLPEREAELRELVRAGKMEQLGVYARNVADVIALVPSPDAKSRPDMAARFPNAVELVARPAQGAVNPSRGVGPAEGGLFGVWVREVSDESLWRSLVEGRCYASWGGRLLVVPGRGRAMLAGYGPRQSVSLASGRDTKTWTSQDYRLEIPVPAAGFTLLFTEPGRSALATSAIFAPF